MKVLTGETYTEPRLYGIIAEMFYARFGKLARREDVTTQLTGTVTNNAITGEVGYLIDDNCEYFSLLPLIHVTRLEHVINGDGWQDIAEEVVGE
jgi:hypothetical protein